IPVLLLFTLPSTSLHAQEEQRWLEPYVMASNQAGRLNEVANEVKEKLTSAGFEIAGEYSPYESARVIVVTNEQLRAHAARSEFGGYGAAV
ncbi:MAG: hypothetical protein GWO39_00375, partial [Gammaproteobacteria bacterium]|nr:hypothetical protein [Gammaproteobacteria bacterium]NIT62302.1 hypothetical protein [Gammaproteobacteria bacterium]NIY30882.1 hypothetical protein [Gammaproteobacteria bacterium]